MNRSRGFTLAAGAALVLGLFAPLLPSGPLPAAAHAIVLESAPAHDAVLSRAPETVMMRFNSKIEKRLTRVTLTRDGGAPLRLPIADGDTADAARLVVPLKPLPPGSYIIRYRVLSADGHVTEGALRFVVSRAQ